MRVVVAAVLQRGDGRFLLARRRPGSHLAGLWEFPGGGVEEGEAPEDALVRELTEELGVTISVTAPVTFAWHRDNALAVLLLFYRASIVTGVPYGREGQELGWFVASELANLPTPPADARLLAQLAVDGGPAERAHGTGSAERDDSGD
jgi:8-oxo-dGTP diphosphatase